MKSIEIYIKASYKPVTQKMTSCVLIKIDKNVEYKTIEFCDNKGSVIEAEYLSLIKIIEQLNKKFSKRHTYKIILYSSDQVFVLQIGKKYKINAVKLQILFERLMKELNNIEISAIYLPKSEIEKHFVLSESSKEVLDIDKMLTSIEFNEENLWI